VNFYSKPIHGLDEVKQFCRKEMDEGIKKDIWSVMEDFSKAPGDKDFSKMKTQYVMFVDVVISKEVCVSIIFMTLHYSQLCQTQLITLCVQYRFDDEVKDDTHGTFTPEMMKISQATWIETFVEGVTDKNTGLTMFKEVVWFVYKVSGVM
jgi:hypothetical protein